jgi:hypothetical protein
MDDRTGFLSPVFGLCRKPKNGIHAELGESYRVKRASRLLKKD